MSTTSHTYTKTPKHQNIKTLGLALLGYSLLTILMTWPTITHMDSAIPGDGFDGWQNYWNQWWIKEALLTHQTHFFFTDILYPPSGVSLLFHTLNYFNGLLSLPIQLLFGPTVAYNFIVFFQYTLSGFGVFLLARYVLARLGFSKSIHIWWPAFIAGVIFTFSPFHMAHLLGHMQVFSLIWPPFYMLWLLRTLNEWRLRTTSSATTPTLQGLPLKDLALTGLFLIFTTMIDWYQTLYMLLFTALVLGWVLWVVLRDQSQRGRLFGIRTLLKPILGITAMGLIFGVIFSPLIAPMIAEAATADYMRPSFEENVVLSADLLAFFTPSELHPWWGELVLPIYQTFTTTTSERLIFAGFIPLALSILAIIRHRQQRLLQFWIIFTAVFFILALGPFLHIAGEIIRIGDKPLPLPYLGLYNVVPFIGISRSLSRFDLMVMVGIGTLSAVGLARFRPSVNIALFALIIIEFLAIPYPMSTVDTPDFFKSIGQDNEDYTIAALPMNWDRPVPLLYQTVHNKRLLTAYTSRQNPLDLSWRTPIFQQWRALQDDIIKADLAALAPTILHDFGVKYIVLDYFQMPPGPERDGTEHWVSVALPNATPVYEDDRLRVYETPPLLMERRPYLQLGEGWGALNAQSGIPSRNITDAATLMIVGLGESNAQLVLEVSSMQPLDTLTAISDNVQLDITLSSSGQVASIFLPPSTDTISIRVVNPAAITSLQLQSAK